MKIYTRSGDNGSTGLFGGPRVSKDDARIEAYGSVDELNACLGVVRAAEPPPPLDEQLEQIQHELFSIGAELATPDPDKHSLRVIAEEHIARLEDWIDQLDTNLPPLNQFILPAGSPASAHLQIARAICRRAERRVVTLAGNRENAVSPWLVVYLNRLSDLLFVQSRAANLGVGVDEVRWIRPK
ncbi:MAG: cob(I)yrinic acid a,c-diamide adenosyltransferase [Pirellulales bacterium]|nr:cob(I)yrinic acid a,c-diamide adenosyltransferase [Pirellulales bacterium]